MSLKIEQRLSQFQFSEKQSILYTTGAYLVPMKIFVNGTEKFVWVADDFKDESFDSEGNGILPKVIADNAESLYDR